MSLKNNINANANFTKNDTVIVKKTTFNQHQDIKMTFDMGKLIPLPPIEVIANDTFSVKVAVVTKLLSPQIKPPLDNIKQMFYAFFVPMRLLDKKWKNIYFGYQENPDWTVDNTDQVSQIKIPKKLFAKYSVADYMGLPTNPKVETVTNPAYTNETITSLPFRAYGLIWNNFFRDENIQNSINVDIENKYGDNAEYGAVNTNNDIYSAQESCLVGGSLLPLNKAHDYFTSALPGPQKGSPVTIKIADQADIVNNNDTSKLDTTKNDKLVNLWALRGDNNQYQYEFQTQFDEQLAEITNVYQNGTQAANVVGMNINGAGDGNPANFIQWGNSGNVHQDKNGKDIYPISPSGSYWKTVSPAGNSTATYESMGKQVNLFHNLKVDLSEATAVSINDLRYAFQIQKIKEADARHGTRYNEGLLAHFGAIMGDSTLQIPEFLGMFSFTIKSIQIAQTSASDNTSPQANLSAYSETAEIKHLFTKSFVEPGYIIILTGIRQPYHIYSQGIDKLWSRKKRFDFYWPELKNIGEQPIENMEIYFDPNNEEQNHEVFGYQEYAATYRFMLNKVVADMRPTAENNLSLYTYADKYNSLPTLSPAWMVVDKTAVNNTLAIPGTAELKQFMSDIYLVSKTTRPMPLHSIPGLIDHSGNLIY